MVDIHENEPTTADIEGGELTVFTSCRGWQMAKMLKIGSGPKKNCVKSSLT